MPRLFSACALLLLALLALPEVARAQATGTITGRVTEPDGRLGLPGVNVRLQNTNFGAATDLEGRYRIAGVAPGTYTVVATAVGYQQVTQRVTVAAGQTVTADLRLAEDRLGLDEVVVTGTGTGVSRRQLGIDVSSVSGEELAATANTVPSIDAALAGRIPGAQITQSGQPGAPSQIILRGINTLGSTQPIVLLDGVQINTDVLANGGGAGSSRLGDIDFNDIERVEVVRGAAAATLYGAQGANGVIQLFSRRGRSGRPQVTLTTASGVNQFVNGGVRLATLHSYPVDADGNILNLTFNEQTRIWGNASGTAMPQQAVTPGSVRNREFRLNGAPLQTYDNLAPLFRDAFNTNNSISVSGGSPGLNYLVSGSAVRQQGIEEGVGLWRNAFRLNLGSQVRDNLSIDARVNLVNSQNQGETVAGNSVNSQIGAALNYPQFINIVDTDAQGRFLPQQFIGQTNNSPLFYKQINDKNAELVRIINSLGVNYRPLRFLELDYKLGIDHYRNQFSEIQDNVTYLPAAQRAPVLSPTGFITYQIYKNSDFNSLASAFLRFNLGETLGLGLPVQSQTQVAYDWRRNLYQRVEASGTGLPLLPGLRTLAALANRNSGEFRSTFTTVGVLANQKFDIGDIGGFSLGARADRSSAFREGESVEVFPRGDVYFRVLEFLPDALRRNVSEFKLRAAYGSAGVQPGPYDRIVTLAQGSIGASGTLLTPATANDPLIVVQRSNELEIGADFGFTFGQRAFSSLGVNATYWDRSSEDAIFSIDAPPSSGVSFLLTNGYDLSSRGFDLGVTGLVFASPQFNWNTTLNFGTQRSRISNIRTGEDVVVTQNGLPFLIREGEDVGAHFGFRAVRSFDEVNPVTGQRYVPAGREHEFAIVNGAVVNIATQGVVFRARQEVLGNATPNFTLGFRNDFNIARNLNVGVQIDWVPGVDIYNATRQRMYQFGTHIETQQPVLIEGSVPDPATGTVRRPINPATGQPFEGPQAYAAYYNSIYQTSNKNEFFIEDGSFVKLREVAVSYNLTPLLGSALPLQARNVSVNFSGRNLLTFTNYTGFDPEVNQGGTSALVRGYDYYTFPNFRTYTVGLTATF